MTEPGSGWYGSDLLVDRLAALGLDYISLNPGASIRGLHDSLVNPPGRTPEMILALFEGVAVAIAHGYAKAGGRPMAVGLHDTVGLLHGSMGIFNAFVDRAPMVIMVGTGPLDAARRRPWLDWIHTVGEQGELVRNFTVFNEQPTSVDATLAALTRATRAAVQAPGGPALVTLDIDVQEAEASAPSGPDPERGPVARIGPDPVLVDTLVADLRAAARPLFVTDRPLSAAGSATLVRLAERVGAGLLELGGGASFPVGHPHDVSEAAAAALAAADHVLFIEVRDPAWALGPVDLATRKVAGAAGDRKMASVGLSALMARSWITTEAPGPDRLEIIADAGLALETILDAWGSQVRPLDAAFAELAARGGPALPEAEGDARGLFRAHVATAVRDALGGHDWILANGQFGGWARRILRFRTVDQWLGHSGGAGLGYGAGASIGAALALRGTGRIVLDFQADGDLLYTPQAMWTAASHGIPLLMVVDGNRTYSKDELHQRTVAKERGRSPERATVGITMETPTIDHAGLARSLGVWSEGPLTDMASVRSALARAVEVVRAGEPAVVEVRTSPR